MANEITLTQADPVVPQNWRPRFIARLYEKQFVLPHVLNVTEDYQDHGGKGSIANIAVEPVYTVNNVGSDGSLTVQQPSLTNVQLNVNKNKEVTVEFTGITREQALKIWEEQFPGSAGNALREQMESDLLALYSDSTATASGDGTGNLGEDEFLAAIGTLLSAKLPIIQQPDKHVFALADTQFGPVRKGSFLDYRRSGEIGGGSSEMDVPTLWNIPVVFSTQVASSGGIRYSLLAHETAFAWAVQRNVVPRMADRLAAAKDSYLLTVLALYGVKTVAAGRVVQLKSKA